MGKGIEIACCLGYQDLSDDDADTDNNGAKGNFINASVVDMWHLRTLAIQPGGLLDIQCRKLSWIKLAGVDDLVFMDGDKNTSSCDVNGRVGHRITYEQIQTHFEREMEVSKWHIQRERRRLRTKNKLSSGFTLSRASSANDLSSIGSQDVSDSSTPLTENLHSSQHQHHRSSGTPKSVTFLSHDGLHGASSNAVSSFTVFPTKSYKEKKSSPLSITIISCPSLVEAVTFDTEDNESSSPSSINLSSTPRPLPTTNPAQSLSSDRFQWNPNPKLSYPQYSQRYQLRNSHTQPTSTRSNHKKDRRPQERKLLIQIASSTVNLLQCQHCSSQKLHEDESDELRYYSGMQDLIAILLLHLESPSLTSLMMKQIWTSHLRMYFLRTPVGNIEDGECQSFFASCIDCEEAATSTDTQLRRMVSSYFPLMQTLDEELHASINRVEMGERVVCKEMHKWISSWFCCHDTLPLHVISRVVDFFLASHPMMPIYLSLAIMCHRIHRNKFLDLSQSSPEDLAFMVEDLFSNLGQDYLSSLGGKIVGGPDDGSTDDFDIVSTFIEEAIVMAVSFMKQAPPPTMNQTSILVTPWTTRSTAPTDYQLVQRKVAQNRNDFFGRFILSRNVDEKYQIALDASGLSAIGRIGKGRNRIVTRILILGAVLFVISQLPHLKHPLHVGKVETYSLLELSKLPTLLRDVNEVPVIENVVESASHGDIASDPTVTSEHDENRQSEDTTLIFSSVFAGIGKIIPEASMHIVEMVRNEDSVGLQIRAGVDTRLDASARKHDEEHQLVMENSKTKQPRKQRVTWIRQRVKRCSARSRRVISGIKTIALQSLLTFREEYIALVENDKFFL